MTHEIVISVAFCIHVAVTCAASYYTHKRIDALSARLDLASNRLDTIRIHLRFKGK